MPSGIMQNVTTNMQSLGDFWILIHLIHRHSKEKNYLAQEMISTRFEFYFNTVDTQLLTQ